MVYTLDSANTARSSSSSSRHCAKARRRARWATFARDSPRSVGSARLSTRGARARASLAPAAVRAGARARADARIMSGARDAARVAARVGVRRRRGCARADVSSLRRAPSPWLRARRTSRTESRDAMRAVARANARAGASSSRRARADGRRRRRWRHR